MKIQIEKQCKSKEQRSDKQLRNAHLQNLLEFILFVTHHTMSMVRFI